MPTEGRPMGTTRWVTDGNHVGHKGAHGRHKALMKKSWTNYRDPWKSTGNHGVPLGSFWSSPLELKVGDVRIETKHQLIERHWRLVVNPYMQIKQNARSEIMPTQLDQLTPPPHFTHPQTGPTAPPTMCIYVISPHTFF